LNLKEAGGQTVRVAVSHDVDAVVEKIKAFVETYNSTLESITGELYEQRYRDYPPLTDEQKKEMSDREIELWEEKARSGMLRGDQLLSSIYNNIRAVTMARVEGLSGKYTSLSSIGITTGHYTERGKLHIDETRLREALTSDPEGVMNLFTQSGESAGQSGVAVKLYDAVNNAMSRITDKAGSNAALYDNSVLGRDISRLNQSISLAEDRLLRLEVRYYRQFTAMEQAINRMNQQSMWLTQMLFSGQNG